MSTKKAQQSGLEPSEKDKLKPMSKRARKKNAWREAMAELGIENEPKKKNDYKSKKSRAKFISKDERVEINRQKNILLKALNKERKAKFVEETIKTLGLNRKAIRAQIFKPTKAWQKRDKKRIQMIYNMPAKVLIGEYTTDDKLVETKDGDAFMKPGQKKNRYKKQVRVRIGNKLDNK